jgi:hypothetical protein
VALRQPARLSNMFRPEFAGHPQSEESGAPGRLPFTAISNVRLRAVLLSAQVPRRCSVSRSRCCY